MTIRLVAGLIKRRKIEILYKMSECFPKPYS